MCVVRFARVALRAPQYSCELDLLQDNTERREKTMADILSGKLNGQVALITGASSGIGAAIAQAFLREGADLVAVARRGERLRALQEASHALNRRCLAVEGDVREDETARRAVRAAIDDLGRLDLLVNNAGMAYYKSLAETSPEEYDTMMDTNMRGTFLFTRHVVPVFLAQRSGSIINIASMAGVMGFAGGRVLRHQICPGRLHAGAGSRAASPQHQSRRHLSRRRQNRIRARHRPHRSRRRRIRHARPRGCRGRCAAHGDAIRRLSHHGDSPASDGRAAGWPRSRIAAPPISCRWRPGRPVLPSER